MEWYFLFLIVLGVCGIMCSVGFFRFLYFISIGYGLAIVGGSIAITAIIFINNLQGDLIWLAILQAVTFIIYGARLSSFLLYREIKSANYRKSLSEDDRTQKKKNVFLYLIIWITVTILYACQVSPYLFRFTNKCDDFILPLVGTIIALLGLILESLADYQKSKQKKDNPNMVACKGLYKVIRCPNYLGEVIYWTGIFVGGISAYHNVYQWIIASIAYVSIVYIMFNGAKRLERKQNERYKDNEEYLKYSNSTPIIIPLIPLYHLNKKLK